MNRTSIIHFAITSVLVSLLFLLLNREIIMTKKNFLPFLLMITFLLAACKNQEINSFSGNAIGTKYTVTYIGKENPAVQRTVDSLLGSISSQFSIFDTNSLVSKINQGEEAVLTQDFLAVLEKSIEISQQTGGAFDITVAPLVNFWGFGPEKAAVFLEDEVQNIAYQRRMIDSIRQFTGYYKISLKDGELLKADSRIKLNFNAIAKGYAVDRIADLLQERGYPDFLVEVGGEVKSGGTKSGKAWKVGIQTPTEDKTGAADANYIFNPDSKAIATSGSYRNYLEDSHGLRYMHIIDPVSGFPKKSNLLSVTVVANNCMTADALATAFMVMGLDNSLIFLADHPDIAAYFIYETGEEIATMMTMNFPKRQ